MARKIDSQIDELLFDFNKFELSMDDLLEELVAKSAVSLRKRAVKQIRTETNGKGKAPNQDTQLRLFTGKKKETRWPMLAQIFTMLEYLKQLEIDHF